jgi:hypothetical protein
VRLSLGVLGMRYRLRDNLYAAKADKLILLDLEADRYFALPPSLEMALREVIAQPETTDPACENIALLVRQKLIVEEPTVASNPDTAILPAAERELILPACVRPHWTLTAQLAAIQINMAIKCRAMGLNRLRADTFRSRARYAPRQDSGLETYFLIAASFAKLDYIFPVADRCLVRTLSFLRASHVRGYFPSFVVGVQARPFSAHCWAQSGDLVLNDRLENVAGYVPILVI